MVRTTRFALNRILCPYLGLEDFFRLTADLGLKKIELRNDLQGRSVIDNLEAAEVRKLSDQYGIEIITINALQKFNLNSMLSQLLEELQQVIKLSKSIRCPAIVLCPNNELSDKRSPSRIWKETVENLKHFAPYFENSGLTGLVEPLGFPESSLGSLTTAMGIIRESGCNQYKIVHDTFHYYLGHDSLEELQEVYDISFTGLIHISGVELQVPKERFRDEHRVLVGPNDMLKTRQQLELLVHLGYSGDIGFEPFSKDIQSLPVEELKKEIKSSIEYVGK